MRRLFAWLRGLLRSSASPADTTAAQLEDLRRAMQRQLSADEAREGRRDG